jgi:hypothetical protein
MEANGKDLVAFFDYAASKGLMKRNWADTLKGASKAVLSTVEPETWEETNLEGLDVDSFINRFQRLRMGDLKPDSLKVYGTRFRSGLTAYLGFLSDPSTWQYSSNNERSESAGRGNKRPKVARTASPTGAPRPLRTLGPAGTGAVLIDYPYPLRAGLVLNLGLPPDLTQREAERLGKFLATVAIDEQRALPPGRVEEAG